MTLTAGTVRGCVIPALLDESWHGALLDESWHEFAGPAGATVRDIMRHTGADIKSWTEVPSHKGKRSARVFLIEVRCSKNESRHPKA